MQTPSSVLTLSEAASTPIGAEVCRGFTDVPKHLSPWLFYDERGSQIFEAITRLPEYYLTRTEHGIFAHWADEILEFAGSQPLTIVELSWRARPRSRHSRTRSRRIRACAWT